MVARNFLVEVECLTAELSSRPLLVYIDNDNAATDMWAAGLNFSSGFYQFATSGFVTTNNTYGGGVKTTFTFLSRSG